MKGKVSKEEPEESQKALTKGLRDVVGGEGVCSRQVGGREGAIDCTSSQGWVTAGGVGAVVVVCWL